MHTAIPVAVTALGLAGVAAGAPAAGAARYATR